MYIHKCIYIWSMVFTVGFFETIRLFDKVIGLLQNRTCSLPYRCGTVVQASVDRTISTHESSRSGVERQQRCIVASSCWCLCIKGELAMNQGHGIAVEQQQARPILENRAGWCVTRRAGYASDWLVATKSQKANARSGQK